MIFFSQVKLTDSLMNTVVFAPAKDAELAWVDGQIHTAAPTLMGSQQEGEREGVDAMPVLDILPQTEVGVRALCWL